MSLKRILSVLLVIGQLIVFPATGLADLAETLRSVKQPQTGYTVPQAVVAQNTSTQIVNEKNALAAVHITPSTTAPDPTRFQTPHPDLVALEEPRQESQQNLATNLSLSDSLKTLAEEVSIRSSVASNETVTYTYYRPGTTDIDYTQTQAAQGPLTTVSRVYYDASNRPSYKAVYGVQANGALGEEISRENFVYNAHSQTAETVPSVVSDPSSDTVTYTYYKPGTNKIDYMQTQAAHGPLSEVIRIYFDESGKRAFRARYAVQGDGSLGQELARENYDADGFLMSSPEPAPTTATVATSTVATTASPTSATTTIAANAPADQRITYQNVTVNGQARSVVATISDPETQTIKLHYYKPNSTNLDYIQTQAIQGPLTTVTRENYNDAGRPTFKAVYGTQANGALGAEISRQNYNPDGSLGPVIQANTTYQNVTVNGQSRSVIATVSNPTEHTIQLYYYKLNSANIDYIQTQADHGPLTTVTRDYYNDSGRPAFKAVYGVQANGALGAEISRQNYDANGNLGPVLYANPITPPGTVDDNVRAIIGPPGYTTAQLQTLATVNNGSIHYDPTRPIDPRVMEALSGAFSILRSADPSLYQKVLSAVHHVIIADFPFDAAAVTEADNTIVISQSSIDRSLAPHPAGMISTAPGSFEQALVLAIAHEGLHLYHEQTRPQDGLHNRSSLEEETVTREEMLSLTTTLYGDSHEFVRNLRFEIDQVRRDTRPQKDGVIARFILGEPLSSSLPAGSQDARTVFSALSHFAEGYAQFFANRPGYQGQNEYAIFTSVNPGTAANGTDAYSVEYYSTTHPEQTYHILFSKTGDFLWTDDRRLEMTASGSAATTSVVTAVTPTSNADAPNTTYNTISVNGQSQRVIATVTNPTAQTIQLYNYRPNSTAIHYIQTNALHNPTTVARDYYNDAGRPDFRAVYGIQANGSLGAEISRQNYDANGNLGPVILAPGASTTTPTTTTPVTITTTHTTTSTTTPAVVITANNVASLSFPSSSMSAVANVVDPIVQMANRLNTNILSNGVSRPPSDPVLSNMRSIAYALDLPSESLVHGPESLQALKTNLERDIPSIKAAGYNTVYLLLPWMYFDPDPMSGATGDDRFSKPAFDKLNDILSSLESNGMKALFVLNFNGPGWSPNHIAASNNSPEGNNWISHPDQYQKFEEYVTHFLESIQSHASTATILLASETLGFGGVSNNDLVRQTIGSLPDRLRPELRQQFKIGFHDDHLLTLGWGNGHPIANPGTFDFFSTVAYGLDNMSPSNIYSTLDTRVSNFMKFYANTPMIIGEFGAEAYKNGHQDQENQAAVNATIMAYAMSHGMGFSHWGWHSQTESRGAGNPGIGIHNPDGTPLLAAGILNYLLANLRQR